MKRLLWITVILAGCAGHPERARTMEPARRIVLRSAGQRPVELTAEAFRAGLLSITVDLPAPPPFATPRLHLRLASAPATEADLARTRRYLEYCQYAGRGGGDCAGVLDEAGLLVGTARAGFALHVALSGALNEAGAALGSIKPEQVRAALSVAILVSTGLMMSPDPFSKLLAITLACNLIAFLGVDLFNHVVRGYLQMREAALATERFEDLVAIGDRYARQLGPSVARVAVMLATFGLAKAVSAMPTPATGLPGSALAAANAKAAGLPLGQVGAVEGVVVANGTVAVTVAGTVAMATGSVGGGAGSAPWDKWVDEEPSSKVLGDNMEAAKRAEKGDPKWKRPPGTAAHHIVAGDAKLAEDARKVLKKFGIRINHPANGVFLPCNSKVPCDAPGAIHSQIHNKEYYGAVNRRLGTATTKEQVIETLHDIASALEAGGYR